MKAWFKRNELALAQAALALMLVVYTALTVRRAPTGALSAGLAGLLLGLSVAGAVLAARRQAWLGVGLASFGGGLAAVLCLGLALGAGRDAWWPAVSFAGLVWSWGVQSVVGAVALFLASRRARLAAALFVPSALLAALAVLLWLWTWWAPVQALEGVVLRGLYLYVHGG